MTRSFRSRVLGVAIVSACGFQATNQAARDGGDGTTLDEMIPDAGPCQALGPVCAGQSLLRTCNAVGQQPEMTDCPWDCVDAPSPHCRELQPIGGTVTAADLQPTPGLGAITATATSTGFIDTDTGEISIGTFQRPPNVVLSNGIEFTTRDNVAIFRLESLALSGSEIEIRGTRAIAIVAIKSIAIDAELDAQGTCTGTTAGPGGFAGGQDQQPGGGSGFGGLGGTGAANNCHGGGGGANGGNGGQGGDSRNGGTGIPTSLVLAGGGGGGGGFDNDADGGGGGGAIQLVANESIRITSNGELMAGGCGGKSDSCGGGGGAGGTIFVEAAIVELTGATFAANGGGGAGAADGKDGADGQRSNNAAAGGNGGQVSGDTAGDGGDGAASVVLVGDNGQRDEDRGGGGGGGAGRIRINSKSGQIQQTSTTFSPALSSTGPASIGSAALD